MALDTRDRRSAAMLGGCSFRSALPVPSGAVSTVGQLRHIAYLGRVAGSDTSTLTTRVALRGGASVGPTVEGEADATETVEGVALILT